jgi:hypothetical protein
MTFFFNSHLGLLRSLMLNDDRSDLFDFATFPFAVLTRAQ